MAHLFCILTNDPDRTGCQLHRLGGLVSLGEPHAMGIGSYGDDDVLLTRFPGTAQLGDLHLPSRSAAVVALAHGPGFVFDEGATDPFRFRRWLFAMDGEVGRFADLREGLQASMPPFVSRQVGNTDREHVFGLFLTDLKVQSRLDDADVPAPDAARSMGRAVHRLDEISREHGHTRPSPLAAVASNGRLLVAVRRGRPLHYALLEGTTSCEPCGIDENTPESDPLKAEHRRCKAVVLATEPIDSGRFIEVPDESVVAVSRNLAITVSSM